MIRPVGEHADNTYMHEANYIVEQTGYPMSLWRACLPEPTEPGVS